MNISLKGVAFKWMILGSLAITAFFIPETNAEVKNTEEEIAGVSVQFGGGRHYRPYRRHHRYYSYPRYYRNYPRQYRYYNRPYYYQDDYYQRPRGSIYFRVR